MDCNFVCFGDAFEGLRFNFFFLVGWRFIFIFFFLFIQCVPFAIKKKYLVKFDFFLFIHNEAVHDGKSQCFYTDQPARHEFLISFWSVS